MNYSQEITLQIKKLSAHSVISTRKSIKYYLNSIKISTLISKLRNNLKKDISLFDAYSSTDINDFIIKVMQSKAIKHVAFADQEIDNRFQERFIISELKSAQKKGIYFLLASFHIEGKLDIEKLAKAIDLTLKQMGLKPNSQEKYFHYNSPIIVNEQLSNITNDELKKVIKKVLQEFYFNVEKQNKIGEIRLYQNEEHTYIILHAHHSFLDGHSLDIFRGSIEANYLNKNFTINDFKTFELDYTNYKLSPQYLEDKEFHESRLPQLTPLRLGLEYATEKFTAERIPIRFDPTTIYKVNKLSEELHVSHYTIISAVFSKFLSFITQRNDIQFSSPHNNRWKDERFSSIIGPLVNTLIHIMQVEPQDSLTTLAKKFDIQFANNLKHSQFNTEAISFLEESMTHIMLTYQNHMELRTSFDGKTTTISEHCSGKSKYPLEFIFVEQKGFMIGLVEYRTEMFDKTYVKYLIEIFLGFLNEMLDKPLTAPQNHRKNIFKGSHSRKEHLKDLPEDTYVLQHFETNAKKHPNKTAIIFKDKKVSYREFASEVNSVAYFLQHEIQISPSDSIGLYLERSYDMLLYIYAIIKLGAHYVPFTIDSPEETTCKNIINAQLNLLITSDTKIKIDKLKTLSPTEIRVQRNKNKAFDQNIDYSDLTCYRLYTSGSTGTPKGVMIHHRALYNRIRWMVEHLNYTSEDNILFKTPYTFDVSLWEIILPLWAGATVVICPEEKHKEPDFIINIIEKNQITSLHFVPTMLREFLFSLKNTSTSLHSLQKVICSGEALTSYDVASFYEQITSRLINLYGPTEATVDVTFYECFPEDAHKKRIPLGHTIDHTDIYILDKENTPLPIGIVGEIGLYGEGVSKGYYELDKLTNEKFKSLPFLPQQKTLYLTGDLGYYDQNKMLHFLKRIDNQIKINGVRVELEDIEHKITHLLSLPCVVLARKRNNTIELAAFINTTDTLDPIQIKEKLHGVLKYAFIPEYIIPIEHFPKTTSGKTDAKKLWELVSTARNTFSELWNPSSEKEKALYASLTQIEIIDEIYNSNLFFQGLNSINILRVISALKKKNFSLKIEDFYNTNSPKSLSKKIKVVTTNLNVNTQLTSSSKLKSSSLQKTMLLHSLHSKEKLYHDIFCYYLNNVIPTKVLEERWEQINSIHVLLKAKIGSDMQFTFHDSASKIIHLEHRNKVETKNFIQELNNSSFTHNKYLIQLFSIHYPKTPESCLIISFNHAILDGYSASVLAQKLIIGSRKPNNSNDYPALLSQIKEEENAISNKEILQAITEYIEPITYQDTNRIDSKLQRTSKADLEPKRKRVEIKLSSKFEKNIKTIGGQYNLSEKETLLSLFYIQALRFTGTEQNAIGIVTHTRTHENEKSLGLFLNTLPFTIINSTKLDFKAFSLLVQQSMAKLFAFRHFPLQKMIEIKESNLFNLVFNYINFTAYNEIQQSKDIKITNVEIIEKTDLPAIFTLGRVPFVNGLYAAVDYDTQFIPKEIYSENWLHDFFEAMEEISELITTNNLPNITQLFQIETPLPNLGSTDVISEIWNNMENYTEAIALKDSQRKVTYGELRNIIYSYMSYIKNTIGESPYKRIVIHPNRSIENIAMYIAINSLGHSIVPILNTLPNSRKEKCIDIVQPQMVIDMNHLPKIALTSPQLQKVYSPKNPYILFTSGSTGIPKAVNMSAGCFNHLITQCDISTQSRHPNETLTTTQFSSLSFDVSFQEIFLTLYQGHTLYVHNSDLFSIHDLLPVIIKEDIKRVFMPYILLKTLTDLSIDSKENFSNLKEIIVAGEALKITDNVRSFFKKHNNIRLINQYGPTETHVVTEYTLPKEQELWPYLPSIGKPLNGTNLFLLDANGYIAGTGVVGEIIIAGIAVADGYLNTKDKGFISISINGVETAIYKTGDLAITDTNGNIHYLNRKDNEFKYLGYRINPAEIESKAAEYIDDKNAYLHVKCDNETTNKLVLFIHSKHKILPDKLIAFLSKELPHYMVPSFIQEVKKLPNLPSGKVDTKKLKLEKSRKIIRESITPNQKNLAKLWTKVIGIQNINPSDDFFAIGGDSLKILYLISLIKNQYAKEIQLQDIYAHASLKSMTDFIHSDNLSNSSGLIPLRKTQKTSNNIIFIHPIGGSIFCYHHVAKKIHSDYNCYAIEGLIAEKDKFGKPLDSITNMANYYVSLIRPILTPETVLSGWSFGGIVAFEMARILQSEGIIVKQLAIIDSYLINTPTAIKISDNQMIEWFIWELIAGEKGENVDLKKILKGNSPKEKLAHGYQIALKGNLLPKSFTELEYKRLYKIFYRNFYSLLKFRPSKALKSNITLLKSTEEMPANLQEVHDLVGSAYADPYNGWKNFINGTIDIHNISGNHLSMMHINNADNIANAINSYMSEYMVK